MTYSRWLVQFSIISALCVGTACSPETQDKAKDAREKIEDKTKEFAEKSKEIAGEVADKGKKAVSATGEAITDGWITAKVRAKFADDTLLQNSTIDVDTKDRVVTLKGAVATSAAKEHAVKIASGTEGVARVNDGLVVKREIGK